MKITVGIPAYNVKKEEFKKCVESIINQTFKPFEIIIVDDGSNPPLEFALPDLKEIPIKVITHKENKGIGEARQSIVDNASEETNYLAFLSADDIWEPNFLEVMAKTALQHSNKVLYSNYYLIDGEDSIVNKTNYLSYRDHKDFCLACLEAANRNTMFVNFSTTFFPKKVFKKFKFKYRFGEDLYFLLVSMKHFEYHFVKDCLLKYRVVDNTTSRIRNKIGENNEKILKEVREYWEQKV